MTKTAERLVTALQELPDEEQEARAAAFLEELQRRKEETVDPYSSFTFLQEANLDLPPDYSETYERHLYGRETHGDA